jgi:hypothetical protein
MLREHPGALTKIIEDQRRLDEDPAHLDVFAAAVTEIGIKGFRTRGTEEHSPQQPETMGVFDKELDRVVRAERLEYHGVMNDLFKTQESQHRKPDQHDGPEGAPHYLGAEALENEEEQQDHQDDLYDQGIAGDDDVFHAFNASQSFDGGGDGDRRGDDPVGQ